jgi:hypothetical protein
MSIRRNSESGSQLVFRSIVGQHWGYPLSTHDYTTPSPTNDTTAQVPTLCPEPLAPPPDQRAGEPPKRLIERGLPLVAPDWYQRVAAQMAPTEFVLQL